MKRTKKIINKNKINKIKHKPKSIKCSKCNRIVKNVDFEAISVICPICTTLAAGAPLIYTNVKKKSDKPKGWAFLAKYVHKDGTVYFRGIEQPDLKGTMEPTDVEKIRIKQKENREKNKKRKEKNKEKREAKLVKEHKIRASIKGKKRKEKIEKIKKLKNEI